ncbi:MAG: 7-cyano-7-deazaguanine synthase QueC [Alphaproteobacteria bacterium]|nr:7-cyano-7-deazaguanine synthase QueC [Alphaproteobacteria bacterium]
MSKKPRAVVLLSGGLDSTTCCAIALDQGFVLSALTVTYGQRHQIEIDAARMVATHFHITDHVVTNIDLRAFGGSALTSDIAVPKHDDASEIGNEIPVTYVPARNTIFLSFALAFAETRNANAIFIGVNALDYSGYPDCRPEYVSAFQVMANLATKAGIEGAQPLKIHTPLIDHTKAQIIQSGLDLGVDYAMTTSCYDPDATGAACGHCDACLLRLKGFHDAGLTDPATYQASAKFK